MQNTAEFVKKWLESHAPETYDMINDTCRPSQKGDLPIIADLQTNMTNFLYIKP